jgi:hypothetical protein
MKDGISETKNKTIKGAPKQKKEALEWRPPNQELIIYKVKLKISLLQAMQAHRGARG